MSKKRKARRDQAHCGPGARTEGATRSASALLADAIKRELDPVAELTRLTERLGGRVIDPNGHEARRVFLLRHAEWVESVEETQAAVATSTDPGCSPGSTRSSTW